jgi:hypothetical protein
MIHLEPLGTDVLLPAFVVGYEFPLPGGEPDRLQGLPPWVVVVDQQAGGLAMSYPSVVGAVLRLEANAERARKDLGRLVRGFRLMAEDPDMGTLRREYPVLAGLVLTHGSAYTRRQLRDLGNILASHLWVPPPRSGIEAFIRHQACDPLDYFRGWRVLRPRLRRVDVRRVSIQDLHESASYHVDEGNLANLELADDVASDEACQRELTRLGQELGRPKLPDVFLLWENSD